MIHQECKKKKKKSSESSSQYFSIKVTGDPGEGNYNRLDEFKPDWRILKWKWGMEGNMYRISRTMMWIGQLHLKFFKKWIKDVSESVLLQARAIKMVSNNIQSTHAQNMVPGRVGYTNMKIHDPKP